MTAASSETTNESAAQAQNSVKKTTRRKLLSLTLVCLILMAAIWALWSYFFNGKVVTTENAYTAAEIADVTALTSAPVAQVLVHDTQAVKAGDVLVIIDDSDAKLAKTQAQANFERTRRSVAQLFANDRVLTERVNARAADLTAALADMTRAKADFEKAELDVQRQRTLAKSGTASQEKLELSEATFVSAQAMVEQAQARVVSARANHAASREEMKANQVLIEGVTIDTHPDVLAAEARLEQAQLDLERTIIRAPISGIVSGRGVEIGQKVQSGQRVMRITPIDEIYVNANFKETQLEQMRQGQLVSLTSDIYGKGVVYQGRVVGLSAGSGSAFAAIPAQNATGNWIKVVQRVPVRIALDEAQLRAHPLRVGLSMHVSVDIESVEN